MRRGKDGLSYREEIWRFEARNRQEAADQRQMLDLLRQEADGLLRRESMTAHFTSSALIFDPTRTRLLLVFHTQFRAWSWVGGHADGEADLLAVALREAREETGIVQVEPLSPAIQSLDILPVWGFEKQGQYIPAHLHLSVGYALVAPQTQPLTIKPDETSGVRWVDIGRLEQYVTEPYMLYIYRKILERILHG